MGNYIAEHKHKNRFYYGVNGGTWKLKKSNYKIILVIFNKHKLDLLILILNDPMSLYI